MKKLLLIAILSIGFYACNSGGGHQSNNNNSDDNNNNNTPVLTEDQIFRQSFVGTWSSECMLSGTIYVIISETFEYDSAASYGDYSFSTYADEDCLVPLTGVKINVNAFTTGAVAGETDQLRFINTSLGDALKINMVFGSSYLKVYDPTMLGYFQASGDYDDLVLCNETCSWYESTGKSWLGPGNVFPTLDSNYYAYLFIESDLETVYADQDTNPLDTTRIISPDNRGEGLFSDSVIMFKQ